MMKKDDNGNEAFAYLVCAISMTLSEGWGKCAYFNR